MDTCQIYIFFSTSEVRDVLAERQMYFGFMKQHLAKAQLRMKTYANKSSIS